MFKNLLNDGNVVRKQIVISVTGVIRPVARADNSGKNPLIRGTYQQGYDGDFLVSCLHSSGKEPSLKISRIESDYLTQIGDVNLYRFFDNLNHVAIKWLCKNDENPFLPAGAGWDGVHSEADIYKISSTIQRLPKGTDEALIGRMQDASYFTDRMMVKKPTRFILADRPVKFDKTYRYAVTEDVNGNTQTCLLDADTTEYPVDNLTRLVLINFVQLKVQGDEKFEWLHYQILRND